MALKKTKIMNILTAFFKTSYIHFGGTGKSRKTVITPALSYYELILLIVFIF